MISPGQIDALQDLADAGNSGAFARDMGTALEDQIEDLLVHGYASAHTHLDGPFYCITLAGHRALSRAVPRRHAA